MQTQSPARPGVVITGPQGSGKTRHAEALRAHFGLAHILDDESWHLGDPVPEDTLVLTNEAGPTMYTIGSVLHWMARRQQDPAPQTTPITTREELVMDAIERRLQAAERPLPRTPQSAVFFAGFANAVRSIRAQVLEPYFKGEPIDGRSVPNTARPA